MADLFGAVLPFMLLLARIGAFIAVLPLFGWRSMPARVKVGLALVITMCLAMVLPPPAAVASGLSWLAGALLVVQEILIGVALGLAVNLLYRGVQQGGVLASRQMGFADAGIIDPAFGEGSQPLALLLEMVFALYLLVNDGHHLLLLLIRRSYDVFPIGQMPDLGNLVSGVVQASSTMLLFALQLAAPILAAFLILSVMLGILARVLPELNILMTAMPLRVALGLFLASALVPQMGVFTDQLVQWVHRLIAV
ncbi:MAG: flagellar biosynthetic protein FliR [Planctomycetota bacterium]